MSIIVPFSFAAFLYLIIALQVAMGFPPLYTKVRGLADDEMKMILPYIFALMLIMVVATIVREVFVVGGVVSAWAGWRLRNSVQARTDGPLNWLLTPLTIGAFNRWPMLAFDAWTLGVVALTGAFVFMGR